MNYSVRIGLSLVAAKVSPYIVQRAVASEGAWTETVLYSLSRQQSFNPD
jgi:hypothetical protein